MGAEQGQGWLGRASGREVGGGSCVEQRDRRVATRSATRAMGREEGGVKTIATSYTASPHCRLSSPPPFPCTRRCRRSITYVSRSRSPAPKAFLATAFLTLGHGDTCGSTILYSGTA